VDFSFSPDQQLVRNSARAFLDEHCTPAVVRSLMDDPRGESETMWKDIAQLGWLGLALPEPYGGTGLGMVETALILEEMGRAAYPGPYFPTVLAGMVIAKAGSAEQKQRWLPAIAAGDARASVALLDADLDWDPEAIATRAEPRGAGYALSGLKRVVPWAHLADVLLVPARVGDSLALFLVEAGAPERFGGEWISPPGTDRYVVAIVGADPTTLARARCIEGPNTNYVNARRSLAEGRDLQNRITADWQALAAEGIKLVSVAYDVTTGLVVVGVTGVTDPIRARLQERYGDVDVQEAGPIVPL